MFKITVRDVLKHLFYAFFFIIISNPIIAQQNNVEYMDNQLIIKFVNADFPKNIKAKTIQQPSVLFAHNVDIEESIWKPEYSNKLLITVETKGKVASIPDIQGLDRVFNATFDSEIDALELAALISELPEVEYAEPRFIYKTSLITNDPIQNDYVDFHRFAEAWDLVSNSEDVIVSIVDSGVNYDHEDLKGKEWVNEDEIPDNGIDDDGNGFIDDVIGWDFVDQDPQGNFIEDNNPFAAFNPHGTHVAGISTAIPDNGVGLAGAGLNARFMAVKVGGIQDDPNTGNDESRSIFFGYDGILYSAVNGADVVNNSWGGGGVSSFGEDVVNFARELGVLVIGSAGNSSTDSESFPGAYDNVLAVGALGNGSTIAGYSNYGDWVDVFATGTVRSTVGFSSSGGYATFNGTSMAAPVVSGLAALMIGNDPSLTPEQVINQIKATAISIEPQNAPSFRNKLGTGRIDAARAVGPLLPNVFIQSEDYLNAEGNDLTVNENGSLLITFANTGGSTSALNISISSQSENITIPSTTFDIGVIETNSDTTISIPISLSEGILDSLIGDILIEIEDEALDYASSRILVYDRLLYNVSDGNNLAISFSGNGSIGFYDPTNSSGGIGFVPDHQTANFFRSNLLYEGGIILTTNDLVVNNLRAREEEPYDQDFEPVEFYTIENPGTISASDGSTIFKSKSNSNIPGVQISLNTYAFDNPDVNDAIILNYIIENTSRSLSFSELYFGLFNDWEIGDGANNSVRYNSADDILYVFEEDNDETPFVSLASFGNTSSVLAIDNEFQGFAQNSRFGTLDGYSQFEKQISLYAEQQNTRVTETDVATVVGTGPYYLPPGATISLGFVYAFGDSEQELFDQIIAARNLNTFAISDLNSTADNSFPTQTTLFQNYPNPFNPSTTFNFTLAETQNVALTVYNILGQEVRKVVNGELKAGIHNYSVSFNDLAGGVYFALLETGGQRELIKLTLIK